MFQSPKKQKVLKNMEPILILDVKLVKDCPQKVIIYENDDPNQVVENFAKLNALDDKKKSKLLEIIQQQLKDYYKDTPDRKN